MPRTYASAFQLRTCERICNGETIEGLARESVRGNCTPSDNHLAMDRCLTTERSNKRNRSGLRTMTITKNGELDSQGECIERCPNHGSVVAIGGTRRSVHQVGYPPSLCNFACHEQ